MRGMQQFVDNRERTILQSGDISAFYKYVNARQVNKEGIAPLFDQAGELAVGNADKALVLNNQFSSVFTLDNGYLPEFDSRTDNTLPDVNISPEKVRKIRCMLPNKYSRSPDGIPSAVLKHLSYELCTPLYIIFQKSLVCGTCPSLWKLADITAIYKKGDPSLACNYRPISILPAMCRLFERILVDEMNYYLYHNHLITDAQYGFVMRRSTELLLLNCSSVWVNAIDAKCFVDIAYIDFAKAFDTVSHTKVLYKLSRYGISGNILKWFTSFLSNRKQRVQIGDAYSDYVDITSGVPQGSYSGPLLFILFANDLPDNI